MGQTWFRPGSGKNTAEDVDPEWMRVFAEKETYNQLPWN